MINILYIEFKYNDRVRILQYSFDIIDKYNR